MATGDYVFFLLFIYFQVNTFIHCFVAAHQITSLYDLEAEICKNEGIQRFDELRLGPLSCYPLVVHYFSVNSESVEVFKISTEEIIGFLHTFMSKSKTKINVEEFLDFVAKEKSVAKKEKLGVRIQSLGYVSYLLNAVVISTITKRMPKKERPFLLLLFAPLSSRKFFSKEELLKLYCAS